MVGGALASLFMSAALAGVTAAGGHSINSAAGSVNEATWDTALGD